MRSSSEAWLCCIRNVRGSSVSFAIKALLNSVGLSDVTHPPESFKTGIVRRNNAVKQC